MLMAVNESDSCSPKFSRSTSQMSYAMKMLRTIAIEEARSEIQIAARRVQGSSKS
jgi:hypothetical protein